MENITVILTGDCVSILFFIFHNHCLLFFSKQLSALKTEGHTHKKREKTKELI